MSIKIEINVYIFLNESISNLIYITEKNFHHM